MAFHGDAHTFSMCADCDALLSWASRMECFCWSFGNVHGDLIDYADESGDTALIAEADARIKSIRQNRRDLVAA